MKKKIEHWIKTSLNEITSIGDVKDIHINELFDFQFSKSEDFINYSIVVLKELSKIAEQINLSNLRLDLTIELKESSNFKGRPTSLKNIIDEVDIYSMPEILLYRPIPNDNLSVNLMEVYRTPILFKIADDIGKFIVIYEEYKLYDDINQKGNYSRWITFVYNSDLC